MEQPISIDQIKEHFPVDTNHTKRLNIKTLKQETRVYQVNTNAPHISTQYKGKLFIIDTKPGQEIAIHPSLVGQPFKEQCLNAATEFLKTAKNLKLIDPNDSLHLQILRGGAGYMIGEACCGQIPVINVRTEYHKDGYRAHSDDQRNIHVTFDDLATSQREVKTLLIPDTFATGRSAEAAVNHMGDKIRFEQVVLYGFIAIPSLLRMSELCERIGVDLISIAICDVTQLAHNNYDMCLYGLDESLYKETGELNALGSIVDEETLHDMMLRYIPGLDQPADWSERQDDLFNGHMSERGDIRGHLEKSRGLVETLDAINQGRSWYNLVHRQNAVEEIMRIDEELHRFP